jgi:hypothetical protein
MGSAMDKHLSGDDLCDYAEGGLEAPARAQADAHLQACAKCRQELDAVRAYFRELASLEPVRAPANFLANVRARLPRPSPWKALWLGFLRPLRVVPLPIAMATLLGVTAITAYLHERGGLQEPSPRIAAPVPLSGEASSNAQPASPVSPAAAPPFAETDAVGGNASDAKADRQEPRRLLQKSARKVAAPAQSDKLEEETVAPRAPGRSSANVLGGSGEASRPMPTPKETMRAKDAPAPAISAPLLAATAAPPEASPASSMTKSEAPAKAEARKRTLSASSASADRDGMASVEGIADEAQASQRGYASGAIASAGAPQRREDAAPDSLLGFTVRLRNMKDTSAVWSGLKAMGAEKILERRGADLYYVLQIPASMAGEMDGYLARYGTPERKGPLSKAGASGTLRIFLLLLPAR